MITAESRLPDPADFLLRSPLYEFFPITAEDKKAVQQIHYFSGTLDAFCVGCEAYSVFKRTFPSNTSYMDGSEALRPKVYDTQFQCSRSDDHIMWFRMKTMRLESAGENTGTIGLGKIGQWPTVADLHTFAVAKYRSLLGAEKYRELTRAIGLASHGIGIGSFVYLRRIFEHLIGEARIEAEGREGFSAERFEASRMEEKILLVADYLPSFLVENRQLYGILSTGVHALSEDACLQYFDTVRTGIELILDERLEAMRKKDKIKRASGAIAKLKGELKG